MTIATKPLSFALEVFSVATDARIYDIQFESPDMTNAILRAESFMEHMFSGAGWCAALQRRRIGTDGETRMQVKTWNL